MAFTTEKRKEYNKKYYEKNRKKILRSLKQKRDTDPVWARAQDTKNKEYYQNNKQEMVAAQKRRYDNLTKEQKLSRQEQMQQRELEVLTETMYRRTRNRASRLDIPFNLELSDIIVPNECPVLGIPIFRVIKKKMGATPNSPSLDRIDSNKGYIKGNVHVISQRANMLKSNATTEEMLALARYFYGLESGTI